jgi:raffinose/stachyose/melibiose transport system permease protein
MKIKKDEVLWLLIFIAPTIILFTLFFIIPLLFLFITSFTNWDGINAEFVGLENYVKLFSKKVL